MRILITHLVAVFLFANPLVIQAKCCCVAPKSALTQTTCQPNESQKKSCCSIKEPTAEVENQVEVFRAASCRNTSDCCCFVGKGKTSFVLPKLTTLESNNVFQSTANSCEWNVFPKTQVESLIASDIPPPRDSLSILYCVCLE